MKEILLPIGLLISAIAGYTQRGTLDLSFANKGYVHEAYNYSLHIHYNFGRQVLAHPGFNAADSDLVHFSTNGNIQFFQF